MLLLLNNTLLLDNTLSNILFTEPINKSDDTGLEQEEDFPKKKNWKVPINEWLRKWSILLTRRPSLTFLEWSKTVPDCYF